MFLKTPYTHHTHVYKPQDVTNTPLCHYQCRSIKPSDYVKGTKDSSQKIPPQECEVLYHSCMKGGTVIYVLSSFPHIFPELCWLRERILQLLWIEHRPLSGKAIVLTTIPTQTTVWKSHCANHNANTDHCLEKPLC
ncbi:hypothetical protein BsWGS_05179 [Bradybaena similaris]